jgi:hypothetical protein
MEVWVLQWEYPYDMESNITLWSTEKAAYQQGLHEINEKIDSDWDMDDPDMLNHAEKIEELVDKGDFREAFAVWNDYQNNYNDEHAEYYAVMMREVLNGEGSDEVVTSAPPIPYKASSPGATCRGSHKEYNPYAYADKPDGTYLCTQCKTFSHIFGNNKP